MSRIAKRWSVAILLIGLGATPAVFAQGTDVALAESLFREGKKLFEAQNFAAGCPKLAESFRLDPATGTLLALAMCHEGQGKTASAWAEYADVASRAKKEGREDREKAARESVVQLEAKLSKITIAVPDAVAKTAGLEIKRDGAVVGSAAWGAEVAIDPGEHTLEAVAPAKKPWRSTIIVKPSADRQTVSIPPLEADVAEATFATPDTRRFTTLQMAGLATAGAGVVAIGIGSYFGLRAMGKKSDAGCNDDAGCLTQPQLDTYSEAKSAGNAATISFVLGGALLAGGAAMFFLPAAKPAPSAIGFRAAPVVGKNDAVLILTGHF